MSGVPPPFEAATAGQPKARSDERDIQLIPPEGLTSLIALVVMLAVTAMAIDDAVWAGYIGGTQVTQTSFLPFGAVLALLVGLLLARSTVPTIRAHAIGATVGAVYLLISISRVASDAAAIGDRLNALSLSVARFANDVVVLGIRSGETTVFLLTLGALLWAAGQFAAFSVFRRQRPLPAIAIIAVLLLVNVSVTVREQYLHIIVFAAAALLLLVRLNLLQQERNWRVRAIGENWNVADSFLQTGALFIVAAMVGSIALAANTASAPLSRVWRDLDDHLIEFGYEVNRVIGGVTGPARGPNILFAPNQTIRELWESSDAIEFRATISDPSLRGYRWRGATYDSFDGRTWQQLDRETRLVEAGDDVLAASAESIFDTGGRQEVLVEVTPDQLGGHVFVSPDGPLAVNQRTEVQVHQEPDGSPGGFVAGRLMGGMVTGMPYQVLAAVRPTDGDGALTANMLAVAGVDYPEWVTRYTDVREGSLGTLAYAQTAQIVAGLRAVGRDDPYHIAEAVQTWLRRTGGFTYTTDVRGLCTGQNLVDCFLTEKQGYCEYFATAMVMMLRTQGIPARYVLGYLPGRPGPDGVWEVPRSAAHAWVEVYFPGHGWVTFDPTPGNVENLNEEPILEAGPPVGSPQPDRPGSSPLVFPPDFDIEERVVPLPGPSDGGPDAAAGSGNLGAAFVALLLALAAVAVLFVGALRRLPRTDPELAYRGVTRIAARFGHGPRPTQTVYEYADGLGELVPGLRPELQVVAAAKVQSAYAGRQLPADSLHALRLAYARVRVGLLRLLWRRPRARRGRAPRSIE